MNPSQAFLMASAESDSTTAYMVWVNVDNLNMEHDRISHNGITKTKAQLCEAVLDRMSGSEAFDGELERVLARVESLG